jgi:hypothetical protein
MTAIRRDGVEAPFSDWIRNEPRLDSIKARLAVTDRDFWIHQYRAHHDRVGARAIDSIMLLEVKAFAADCPFAQRDTLTLVHQLLTGSDLRRARSYRRLDGPNFQRRVVRSFGVVQLRLSGDRPDRSEWMEWQGRRIDVEMLIELLTFQRDPHCPSKKLEYRRHHLPSVNQVHPTLFGEAAE